MMRKLKNIYHRARAILALLYFRFPAKNLKVIGITGTDGKTTTSFFLYQILLAAGKKVALISTIEARFNDQVVDVGLHVTNPDTWQLQGLLRQIADSGIEYVVLEVTSHGIDQGRIFGIPFVAAGLTNITHEHLDYHNTFEEYQRVKLGFINSAPIRVIAGEVDEKIIKDVLVKLPGAYNILNAKLAAALAEKLGIDQTAIRSGIESLAFLPGRMEIVYDEAFQVVVDFAHTPNGLESALSVLQAQARERNGRLIAVFGSAGERDQAKRPIMGETAGKLADLVIVTAEDPRSESVDDISRAIAVGLEKVGKVKDRDYFLINDRTEAIRKAVKELAKVNDVVVMTGKGHEKSMNYGQGEVAWSDQETVRQVLH